MLTAAAAAGAIAGVVVYSESAHAEESARLPIDSEHNILPHETFPGPQPDSPALVFIHGWPDDLTVFRAYAKELCRTYFCVSLTLPGYPTPPGFTGHAGNVPKRKWGYTFDEAVLAAKATIDLACAGHVTEKRGVTLVLHDWGCIVGHLLVDGTNLNVHRVVSMDVGARPAGLYPVFLAVCIAYQGLLNLCWLLPTFLGSPLTLLVSMLLFRTAMPGSSAVSSEMNWVYRASWREMLTPGNRTGAKQAAYFCPPKEKPFLFLHSVQMPPAMRFFGQEFADMVTASTPVSRVVPMEGSHWFLTKYRPKTLQLVQDWLKETHDY